ncbi:hypothetical protein [Bradyrhizobium canariense]|nr:hypothetical protein [Bradyrhizobium canariense]
MVSSLSPFDEIYQEWGRAGSPVLPGYAAPWLSALRKNASPRWK